MAGSAALFASAVWRTPLLDLFETCLTSLGAVSWSAASPGREAILIAGVVLAIFMMQAFVATLGGLIARGLKTGQPPEPRRSRLVPLGLLILLVAVPVFAIEAYLRVKVDPALERLTVGSLAVIDFRKVPDFPVLPPKGSPIASLGGVRVRVDTDGEVRMPEKCMSRDGTEARPRPPRDPGLTRRRRPGGRTGVGAALHPSSRAMMPTNSRR